MDFPQFDFNQLNETDVREEIISPLLRELGYRSGTSNNIIREQMLKYPKIQLGRKNPGKDPLVRGKFDYLCEVKNLICWVIEAKSPDIEICLDDIEQAYTYANHPEVRAVYFCITNGRKFNIYITNQGPKAPPIFSTNYQDFQESLITLKNILEPKALLRDFPNPQPDTRKPIGPGLRSIVRITNGFINYTSNSLNNPALNQLTVTIEDGVIERNENGHLIANLRSMSPIQYHQRLNEKLGLTDFEVTSEDEFISESESNPTILKGSMQATIPAGEKILDLTTWKEVTLLQNLTIKTETIASGYLIDGNFIGSFEVKFTLLNSPIPKIILKGDFKIHLA